MADRGPGSVVFSVNALLGSCSWLLIGQLWCVRLSDLVGFVRLQGRGRDHIGDENLPDQLSLSPLQVVPETNGSAVTVQLQHPCGHPRGRISPLVSSEAPHRAWKSSTMRTQ